MPLIKSKSKKAFSKNVATEMEHGKPQKQSLAIAYDMQRQAGRKKMAEGGKVSKKYEGGAVYEGPTCKGCEDEVCYARGVSEQDSNSPGSLAEMIRAKRMAKGGKVGDAYEYDIDDQIEHPNDYDALNEDAANELLYDDTYGTDPRDSNEKGDKLSDADQHGRKLFSKIKMKRAQPGDRGNY